MTNGATRRLAIDQPVFFPPEDMRFFGLVSHPPEGQARKTGVVLLSGTFPGCNTIGRNRMWVDIARTLANDGFPTIRFDYAGFGESLECSTAYDMTKPAVETLRAAMELLGEHGVERFVLAGTCYGSRTALAGAVDDDRVSGLLLLAPPVSDVVKGDGSISHLARNAGTGELAKRAFSPRTIRRLLKSKSFRARARRTITMFARSRLARIKPGSRDRADLVTDASHGFVTPLQTLVQHEVPIRILYGADDYHWVDFQKAQAGSLAKILVRAGDLVEVQTTPGILRGFISPAAQETTLREVVAWARRWES